MGFRNVIFKVNLFERENFTGNKVATKSVNLHSQKLPVYVYGMSGKWNYMYIIYLSNNDDFFRNFGNFLLEKKLLPIENVQHNSFSKSSKTLHYNTQYVITLPSG